MKVVIVGGSAGGASVAARLRRLSESAEICIIEKSSTISFATCGIPYYMGGVIRDRERLNVIEETDFASLLNVEVKTNHNLVAIDRSRKTVLVQDNQNKAAYEARYDKLVLAPGGSPVIPDISGVDAPHVFTLRNAEDTDSAYSYIKENNCHSAAIIGAGFIGLELAENLHARGMKVSLIDSSSQVMGAWDYEMAAVLQQHLRDKGINLSLNEEVTRIDADGVVTSSDTFITANVVFLCIGVKPNNRLAKSCHLEIGDHGGIKVNQGMRTSDENIYALGDAVEVQNSITNQHSLIPLAGIAQRQARVVADNICGMHKTFQGAQGNAIAKVFDLTVGIAGLSERQIKEKFISYRKSYIETLSHAGFYPDSFPMIIKLLFTARTGRILGAQIIGTKGVDKRIDVIASAITFEKTIHDLADLELTYAPPYSSAKDPVNLIAMTAVNMAEHDYRVVHWDDLDDYVKSGAILVDVRTYEEYELGSLDGALHLPLSELRSRYLELPTDRTIIVYCQQGKKGYFAAKLLEHYGFEDVRNLSGGQKLYQLVREEREQQQIKIVEQTPHSRAALTIDTENSTSSTNAALDPSEKVMHIDARGMNCPGPIMFVMKKIRSCTPGQLVKISTTDPGFVKDIKKWTQKAGHNLVNIDVDARSGTCTSYIRLATDHKQERYMPSSLATLPYRQPKITKLASYLSKTASTEPVSMGVTNMLTVDACGLNCPGPIMKLTREVRNTKGGDIIEITATDNGFERDIAKWTNKKGFKIVRLENNASKITAVIQKL